MPAHNGLSLNNVKGIPPPRPEPRQDYPEQPICVAQPWPRMVITENGELLPKDQVLESQLPLRTQR